MRMLCLGGSFNPIHVGHLICARFAAEFAGFDGVKLLPTAANPHKSAANAQLAAADLRIDMLRAATQGDPFFLVDPSETRRPGPSFTFDTARHLIDAGEPTPITFLVGTDLLPRLHTWHRFDELIDIARFVVMKRAGDLIDHNALDDRVRLICSQLVNVPQIEISSTLIRARVAAGKPIDGLVHPAVQKIIEVNGLYRG
jgi:nicotinate-nucleotide adenylyltransferase